MLVRPGALAGVVGLVIIVTALACGSSYSGDDSLPMPDRGDADVACEGCDVDAAARPDASPMDPFVQLSGGALSACALRSSGKVLCWGDNGMGAVGVSPDGDLACEGGRRCRGDPIEVPGLDRVTHVSVGFTYACARRDDGTVLCWGDNGWGVLGTGSATPRSTYVPTRVLGLPAALDVTVGRHVACSRVSEDGGVSVYCWGYNAAGLLGSTPSSTLAAPARIAALSGAKALSIGIGASTACAILADDSVACWGQNFAGNLGHALGAAGDVDWVDDDDVTKKANPTPMPVSGGLAATQIAVGSNACARLFDGTVACWGDNGWGNLGLGAGDALEHPSPSPVPGLGSVTAISVRSAIVCAISAGQLWCWGSNLATEIGMGKTTQSCASTSFCRPSPVQVTRLPGVPTLVEAPGLCAMAGTADGALWGWGINPDGRIGHAPGTSGDVTPCRNAVAMTCGHSPVAMKVP